MPKTTDRPPSRSLEELTLLYRIGQTLDRDLDLRHVAEPLLQALAEQMGMTYLEVLEEVIAMAFRRTST